MQILTICCFRSAISKQITYLLNANTHTDTNFNYVSCVIAKFHHLRVATDIAFDCTKLRQRWSYAKATCVFVCADDDCRRRCLSVTRSLYRMFAMFVVIYKRLKCSMRSNTNAELRFS